MRGHSIVRLGAMTVAATGQDSLAPIVCTDVIEQDDMLARSLFFEGDGRGDRVARRDGLHKLKFLAEVDCSRPRRLRAEDRGDQRARPHPVGNDVPELVGGSKSCIQMCRIDVAGDRGEGIDVVPPDDAEAGAIAARGASPPAGRPPLRPIGFIAR